MTVPDNNNDLTPIHDVDGSLIEEPSATLIERTKHLVPNSINIDIHKAYELRCRGFSYKEIAAQMGKSRSGVIRALKRFGCHHAKDSNVFKENKANVLEGLQWRLVSSVTDEEILRMNTRDKFIAIGILHDKIRLERNQSTQNHAVGVLTQSIRDSVKNG